MMKSLGNSKFPRLFSLCAYSLGGNYAAFYQQHRKYCEMFEQTILYKE